MLTSRRSLGSRLVLLAASMLLGACGGRSVSGTLPDARVDSTYRPDGGTPPDGGKRPDGGNQADAGCVEGDSWQLVEVPLDSVTVLTNEAYPDRIPEGVAIRIEAVIEVGGCDEVGGLDWWADETNRRVVLRASIWSYHGHRPCPEFVQPVPLYAVIPGYQLSRGPWTAVDGSSGISDPAQDSFRIGRCPWGEDCFCENTPRDGNPGDPCVYDCECGYPAVCVHDGLQGGMPGYGRCYYPCNTDGDCPAEDWCALDQDDMPPGICLGGRTGCGSDEDCDPGYACRPTSSPTGIKLCQPDMDIGKVDLPCQDECDCPPGFWCVDTGNGDKLCEIPCRAQSECPEELCCGLWMDLNLYTGPYCSWCVDRGGGND